MQDNFSPCPDDAVVLISFSSQLFLMTLLPSVYTVVHVLRHCRSLVSVAVFIVFLVVIPLGVKLQLLLHLAAISSVFIRALYMCIEIKIRTDAHRGGDPWKIASRNKQSR